MKSINRYTLAILATIAAAVIQLTGCNEINQYELSSRTLTERTDMDKYYLSTTDTYQGAIYYINPDNNKVYLMADEDGKDALFFDAQVNLFCFTKEYFIYIDDSDMVYIMKTDSNAVKKTGCIPEMAQKTVDGDFYSEYPNCIIYDEFIVYKTQNGDIAKLTLDDLHIEKIVENEEIYSFFGYMDTLIYVVKSDKISHPNSMYIIDLETGEVDKVADGYFYNPTTAFGDIYYINNYSIYKMSMADGHIVKLVAGSSIHEFEITKDSIIYRNLDGLMICNKDGTNVQVISENDVGCLLLNGEEAFCFGYDTKEKFIVNLKTMNKTPVGIDGVLIDIKTFGDILYLRYGKYDSEKKEVYDVEVMFN